MLARNQIKVSGVAIHRVCVAEELLVDCILCQASFGDHFDFFPGRTAGEAYLLPPFVRKSLRLRSFSDQSFQKRHAGMKVFRVQMNLAIATHGLVDGGNEKGVPVDGLMHDDGRGPLDLRSAPEFVPNVESLAKRLVLAAKVLTEILPSEKLTRPFAV